MKDNIELTGLEGEDVGKITSEKTNIDLYLGRQNEVPRANLPVEVKKIEGGKLADENPESVDLVRLRAEINALTAYSISEFWCGIKDDSGKEVFEGFMSWLGKNPPGLAITEDEEHVIVGVMQDAGIKKKIAKMTNPDVLKYLSRKVSNTINAYISSWVAFHEGAYLNQSDSSILNKQKIYQRYKEVLAKRDKLKPNFDGNNGVMGQITSGVRTAVDVYEDAYSVATSEYESIAGKSPTAEDIRTIVSQASPTIFKFASSDLISFFDFLYHKTDEKKFFVLVKRDGKVILDLNPDILEAMSNPETLIEEQREIGKTGCPALAAKGSDGKSMLLEFAKYYESIVENYYLPQVTQEN